MLFKVYAHFDQKKVYAHDRKKEPIGGLHEAK